MMCHCYILYSRDEHFESFNFKYVHLVMISVFHLNNFLFFIFVYYARVLPLCCQTTSVKSVYYTRVLPLCCQTASVKSVYYTCVLPLCCQTTSVKSVYCKRVLPICCQTTSVKSKCSLLWSGTPRWESTITLFMSAVISKFSYSIEIVHLVAPDCSRLPPATDYDVRDGRSNLLSVTPH